MNGINSIARTVVKIEIALAVWTEANKEIIMAAQWG
jgi:hypothetical protein